MDAKHQQTMDRVYRHMKHVYDATRPLFLAGRGPLRRRIAESGARRVLEVGCGTARNLILMAREMPEADFVGIDISREMCSYARAQVARHGLSERIEIFEGELDDYLGGDDVSPARQGAPFDAVVFSFSLSMIPGWWEALVRSFDALPKGGRVLIADFGACQSWPRLARWRLYKNLSHFHVFPRTELADRLDTLEGLVVHERRLIGGYGVVLDVTVPAGFRPPDDATSVPTDMSTATMSTATRPIATGPALHGDSA